MVLIREQEDTYVSVTYVTNKHMLFVASVTNSRGRTRGEGVALARAKYTQKISLQVFFIILSKTSVKPQ